MPITNMWFSVTFITFLEEQKLFFFRMCLQIFFRKFVYCTKHSSFFSLPANSHRSPFCDHTAFRMFQITRNRRNFNFFKTRCSGPYSQNNSRQLIECQRPPGMTVTPLIYTILHAGCQMIAEHISPEIPLTLCFLINTGFFQSTEQIIPHGYGTLGVGFAV